MPYLISQYQNLTPDPISFIGEGVRPGRCPVRDLNPNSNGIVKLYRILRYCRRQQGLIWSLSVFRAGKYTGVELTHDHLTKCTRLVFRCETDAEGENKFLVEGVPEKRIDFLFSNRLFGYFWRNDVWDKRRPLLIGKEDPPRSDNTQTCSNNGELNPDHCHAVQVEKKDGRIKISMEIGKEGESHKIILGILELAGLSYGTFSCTSASSYSRLSSGLTQSDTEDNSDHF